MREKTRQLIVHVLRIAVVNGPGTSSYILKPTIELSSHLRSVKSLIHLVSGSCYAGTKTVVPKFAARAEFWVLSRTFGTPSRSQCRLLSVFTSNSGISTRESTFSPTSSNGRGRTGYHYPNVSKKIEFSRVGCPVTGFGIFFFPIRCRGVGTPFRTLQKF
jgi:hypothetical protein